nr:ceramide glucosyltransferase [Quercus suber]
MTTKLGAALYTSRFMESSGISTMQVWQCDIAKIIAGCFHRHSFTTVLAACSTFVLLLTFLFQYCVVRMLSKRKVAQSSKLPGITILKPLKGVDPELLNNLRTFGVLDYPEFEIIFGCEDPCDPVRSVVEQFAREFPQVRMQTRFGHPTLGLNPKVANLAHMTEVAQHNLLLVSDASVQLRPDALRVLVDSLDENVGMVCNIIVGVGHRRFGALLDCLHMNSFVASSIAGARSLAGYTVVVGKSMLIRRHALMLAGGWEGVRDVLAEDYVLGRRVEQAGLTVVFSSMPIRSVDPERSVAEFFARHVRWAQMRRHLSLWFWTEIMISPSPWWIGVLALSLLQNERILAIMAISALISKALADFCLYRFLTGKYLSIHALMCIILKDCIVICAWVVGMPAGESFVDHSKPFAYQAVRRGGRLQITSMDSAESNRSAVRQLDPVCTPRAIPQVNQAVENIQNHCGLPVSMATPLGASYSVTFRIAATTCRASNAYRAFSTTSAKCAKNRIYPTTIRKEDELQTLVLMSASTRIPLITFWMTNWCQSCKVVSPMIRELLTKEGVGEAQGSVSYVEVEMDSPDLGGVGGVALTYGINSMPTLLAFDRQEPQLETKISRLDDLKNKAFLTKWIETEAARHGSGGAGGLFSGLFGR